MYLQVYEPILKLPPPPHHHHFISSDHREKFSDSFVPGDSATGSFLSSGVKVKPEVKSEIIEETPSHKEQLSGKNRANIIMDVFHAGMEEIRRQSDEKTQRTRKASKGAKIQSLSSPEKPYKRCAWLSNYPFCRSSVFLPLPFASYCLS